VPLLRRWENLKSANNCHYFYKTVNMNEIQNDLLYEVYAFLTPADMARLSATSRKFRTEHEHIGNLVWVKHAASRWGLSEEIIKKNLGHLNSLKLQQLFPYSSKFINGITCDDHEVVLNSTSMCAEFVGRVGENNRSIQGNSSFPSLQPKEKVDTVKNEESFIESMISFATVFAENFVIESEKEIPFPDIPSEKFCLSVPFVTQIVDDQPEYYVKPRTISYYEVEIQPSAAVPRNPSTSNFECVAVGLATKSFLRNKRLPGWDNESFGYHGDDGAIFHGQGRQLSEFGPQYGCDDIVGCGLNHADSSIFFTLNGKILGTAFTEVPNDKDLYPTVGIDSNCAVNFNFGMKPFRFDLVDYIETCEKKTES